MAVVDQWPANREQAQRWQMVVWTLIKSMRISLRAQGRCRGYGLQAAKPAFAPLKGRECLCEIFGPKIRPHPFGEMQFGVSALPQQEVGQSLLAAGPDDEIDVAKFGFAGDQPREAGAREFIQPGGLSR